MNWLYTLTLQLLAPCILYQKTDNLNFYNFHNKKDYHVPMISSHVQLGGVAGL